MSEKMVHQRVIFVFWIAVGGALFGCKNVVKPDASFAPQSTQDYSYVKFAAYEGDLVLSAGQYLGHATRDEVRSQAEQDLATLQSSCEAGEDLDFCHTGQGQSKPDWIQLFLPDGSSCAVGQIPDSVDLKTCE